MVISSDCNGENDDDGSANEWDADIKEDDIDNDADEDWNTDISSLKHNISGKKVETW